MDYINVCEPYYSLAESHDEAAAAHQMALDVLYRVGCQYGVKAADMMALCQLAGIAFTELQKYSGAQA